MRGIITPEYSFSKDDIFVVHVGQDGDQWGTMDFPDRAWSLLGI